MATDGADALELTDELGSKLRGLVQALTASQRCEAALEAELDAARARQAADQAAIADLLARVRVLEAALSEARAAGPAPGPGPGPDRTPGAIAVDDDLLARLADEPPPPPAASDPLAALLRDLDAALGPVETQAPAPPQAPAKPLALHSTLHAHLDGARALAFTDGWLATGSLDATVKLWSVSGAFLEASHGPLAPSAVLRGHAAGVLCLAAARDGSLFLSGDAAGVLCAWSSSSSSSALVRSWTGHADAVWGLGLLEERARAVSLGADGAVRAHGLQSGSDEVLTVPRDKQLTALALPRAPAAAGTAALGLASGEVMLLSLDAQEVETVLPSGGAAHVNALAAAPDEPLLVAAHEDGELRLLDLRTGGAAVRAARAHEGGVAAVSVAPDGMTVATGGHDGQLRVWNLAELRCVEDRKAHIPKFDEAVHAVAHHPTRGFVGTGGAEGAVKLWW